MNEFQLDDERLARGIAVPIVAEPNIDACPSRWVEPMWSPESESDVLELDAEVCEREASRRPWALVLDGGDLRDIERMLDAVGVPVVRLTSGLPGDDDVPRRLMIASGSRAFQFDQRAVDKDDRVVTMALLSKPSKALARRIRNMGFDYVVERPVHPDALRHLLYGALYRGDERRCEQRFAAGYAVAYRAGWRRRPAMLTELSRWGCSLKAADAPKFKAQLKVYLPAEFTGASALVLPADILRVERNGHVAKVSAVFRRDPKTRARVGALLPQLRRGPSTLEREPGAL